MTAERRLLRHAELSRQERFAIKIAQELAEKGVGTGHATKKNLQYILGTVELAKKGGLRAKKRALLESKAETTRIDRRLRGEGGGRRFCPTWPTTYFELAFDLLMEGRGGVSVSVGDVPESGLGELGGGVGLRLSFAEGLLRVWHRVELVHEQPLPGYWCQLDVTINPPEQVCRSDADERRSGRGRDRRMRWSGR